MGKFDEPVDLLRSVDEVTTADFLNRLRGKTVTLLLENGGSVTGKVVDGLDYASATTKMVHVTALEGKELFDAVIPKHTVVGFVFRKPS
jgi:small nuclear ribonucleoprotein (snRNP)-like protein